LTNPLVLISLLIRLKELVINTIHKESRISPVHKLVYYVLYVDRPDIFSWGKDLTVTAKLSPLSKALSTTNYRLKDYFVKLEGLGVITDLSAVYNHVTFKVNFPPSLVKLVKNDE
jgi:hypothetical protein